MYFEVRRDVYGEYFHMRYFTYIESILVIDIPDPLSINKRRQLVLLFLLLQPQGGKNEIKRT
ncbi:hypothetical protein PSDVSF_27590 [Pseudodesulfovibrio sediminis]|uniref:Uncharacterized protein n=1 Tax=Pseudodesulfovibrio sediminis TaxID=2810563 RepID=A0ABM7P8Z5_9BACT|nr:hypothetical protein PSDVSF_27590 [Pseudodesulfovibrio sediminis]